MEPFAANGSSSRAADGVKRPTEIAEIAEVAAVAGGAPYLLNPPRKVDNRIVVRRGGVPGAAVEEDADETEEQEGGGGGRGGKGGRSGSRWQHVLAYPHVLDSRTFLYIMCPHTATYVPSHHALYICLEACLKLVYSELKLGIALAKPLVAAGGAYARFVVVS